MSVFKTIWHSIYSPAFYTSEKAAPAKRAWKYFFLFFLLLSVCSTVVFSIRIIFPLTQLFSPQGIDKMVSLYPRELKLTIKNGHASTNVVEPYLIAIPANLPSSQSKQRSMSVDNIVAIDTKATTTYQRFDDYKTLLLITSDSFIARKNGSQQLTVNRFPADMNVTIDQDQIRTWITSFKPQLKWIVPLLILCVLAGIYIGSIILGIIFIAVLGLVVWLVQKLRGLDITYGQTFKLGLYAITAAEIIDLVLSIFGASTPWYLYIAFILIAYFVNMSTMKPHASKADTH
jgi:Protein of unknown function (DUF1189)